MGEQCTAGIVCACREKPGRLQRAEGEEGTILDQISIATRSAQTHKIVLKTAAQHKK